MFNTYKKQKLHSALFIIAIFFTLPCQAMMTYPHLSPITQKPNADLDTLRTALRNTLIQIGSSTVSRIIDTTTAKNPLAYNIIGNQKRGVCFHYAFSRIFQITQPLEIIGSKDWIDPLNCLSFFKQTDNPKKNCLVVYTHDSNSLAIQHVGVITSDDKDDPLVESKWGMPDEIVKHHLFKVPKHYGDCAGIFELKEKYADVQIGKSLILKKILSRINQASTLKDTLIRYQNDLNRLAAQQNPLFFTDFSDHPLPEIASFLLKKVIGIDINKPNANNKTPLMIAAEEGNLKMVIVCIEYGADKNIKNANGKTAADLAHASKQADIVQFLQKS